MISYLEWKKLNESIAPMTLGLKKLPVVGGVVGSKLQEAGFDKKDDEDVDLDDDDTDLDDEEDEGLDGDLLGASEDDGPEKAFPPDDSEELDGLPTPDQEMLGNDDDAKVQSILGDVDPELAGFDRDLGGMGGDEMSPEMDAAGGDMGDEMGPELGVGDEMMGEPCPDCNPDGAEEEGDPNCPTCQGLGFMDNEMGDDEMGGEELPVDAMDDGEGMEFMNAQPPMMMRKKMDNGMGMDYMSKCGACETVDDFMKSITGQATGEINKKFSGGISEDALFMGEDPNTNLSKEPAAGEVGFAPQGRVGAIGGGYTQDDMKTIPVLGESKKAKK